MAIIGFAAYGTAGAQVVTPPQMPKAIEVFPARDFVLIDGYVPNADVLVQVRRGNSVVGVARGTTSEPFLTDPGGFLEVNHPGGVCWTDVTPDITGYDIVQVTYDNTPHNQALQSAGTLVIGSGAATRTAAITVQSAVISGTNVVIKGKALQGITAIPLARIEVAIRNKAFLQSNTPNPPPVPANRIDKQDIRITSAGADVRGANGAVPGVTGTLVYDARTTACPVGCFTATFIGLNETERNIAIAGVTSGSSWQAVDTGGNLLGLTIYEAGEVGGPSGEFLPPCPPGPGGAVAPNPPAYPVPYNPANLINAEFPPADLTLLKPVVPFPARDFVNAEGWPVGTDLQIVVRRPDPNNPNNLNGVIVGTARGTTYVGAQGVVMLEVNHPGGICWSGQTPDIRDGDTLDVFEVRNGLFYQGQTQRIIAVKVTGAAAIEPDPNNPTGPSVLVIRGTKPADQPLTRMEHEIVNPTFRDVGIKDRNIRADTLGGRIRLDNGTILTNNFLELDGSDTKWKATYRGLDAIQMQVGIKGDSSITAWLSTNPNPAPNVEPAFGLTIYEYGVGGGPNLGGCPATGGFTIPIPLP